MALDTAYDVYVWCLGSGPPVFYLCDPGAFLLTDDNGLRGRVGMSPQGVRILEFREFLKDHGFMPRH
jgi:hypothetical protein